MKPTPHEIHKEHTFDSYCKKVIKNELRDFFRDVARLNKREVMLTDMDKKAKEQLFALDEYLVESHLFHVLGDDIAIQTSSLAYSLKELSEQELNIIVLYYVFDLSDRTICELLGISRQSVQAKRIKIRKQLKTMMEEF